MTESIKVTLVKNGPMKIDGFERIEFDGKVVASESPAFLCRCGQTSTPPFCNGTHKRVDFDDSNQSDERLEGRDWQGRSIKTHFDPNLCMHAHHCRGLGKLREMEPDDPGVADKIAEKVASCPSGALSYEWQDKSRSASFPSDGVVRVQIGGEVRISSPVDSEQVIASSNRPANRWALCRCGQSKNKPYCDASHDSLDDFK